MFAITRTQTRSRKKKLISSYETSSLEIQDKFR